MSARKVYWLNPPPKSCHTCSKLIRGVFIDGRTKAGPWAFMCEACWRDGLGLGGALGLGRGQKYKEQLDGKWLKVEG